MLEAGEKGKHREQVNLGKSNMKKQQLLWAFSLHPHHRENGFHFGATDGLELSKSETVAGKQQPCVRQ